MRILDELAGGIAYVLLIVGAFLALHAEPARSQPYAGIRNAVTTLEPNAIGRTGPRYDVKNERSVTNLFAGYHFGDWAVEVGGGSLARRTAHNVGATFDIVQDISASHVYIAGLRRWRFGDMSVHAMLGATRVMFKNHEYGTNENGPGQTQLNYGADRAPIYGFGGAYRIDHATSVRLDAFRIDKVVRSHWTGDSDITFIGLGLQRSF